MALPSSAIASSSCREYWRRMIKGDPKIALVQRLPCQPRSYLVRHIWNSSVTNFYVRSSATGPFNEPLKLKIQFDFAVKKFNEFVPDSVRKFAWKRAESTAMQELLVLGQKALKWSLIALFILSSSSDISYSISRNKELLVPFGLFFGCLTTDFLKEISQEFFHSKDRGVTWHLIGISCFFVLVKIIAVYFLDRQSFLLHTANGGLMQVLWRWSSSQAERFHTTNVILEDASTTSSPAN